MPNKDYAITMARYNLWQNEVLLAAADELSEAQRQQDTGLFFGSIQQTLSHLFWGDLIWMSRFADTPAPEVGIPDSVNLIEDWKTYVIERKAFDQTILEWAKNVSEAWFDGDLSWFSGAIGRDITKPKKTLVIQLFNHQTHHRGQVHGALTGFGVKTDNTDVPFMPDRYLQL
ncbi:DinB family protein [Roseovarius sp. EL26]|uniref:DinB family protein n=1 Tax=Roseovarius sp. EL26 TaxID=2126672 RepID=UPI000EA30023|nr:DinB family protein [Roseovarius sp. EL26]